MKEMSCKWENAFWGVLNAYSGWVAGTQRKTLNGYNIMSEKLRNIKKMNKVQYYLRILLNFDNNVNWKQKHIV